MIRVDGTNNAGGTSPVKMPAQSGGDSISRNLQSQIAEAQKQLQELAQNQEIPREEKMKRRQELNQKINDLTNQLKQHEAELRKKKQQEAAEAKQESPNQATSKDGDTAQISTAGMEAALSADSSLQLAKVQARVKKKMQGQARVMESEIKADAARGQNVEKKQNALSNLTQRIAKVSSSQVEDLVEASQALQESSESKADTTAEIAKRKEREEKEAELERKIDVKA